MSYFSTPFELAFARRAGALALGAVICYFAKFFVSRFQKLNAKALTAVVGLLLSVVVGGGIAQLFEDQIALAIYPIGLLLGLLVYELMPGPVSPDQAADEDGDSRVRKSWRALLGFIGLERPPECRIFIFGLSRSGKTTMIEQIFGMRAPMPHPESTTDFAIYSHSVRLRLSPEKFVQLSICDYKGQKPSQVLVDPPKFFGARNHRRINVLVFLADCVPEMQTTVDGVLSDVAVVDTYARGAKKKLDDRIAEHAEYLGRPSIEMVFRAALSKRPKNLFAVRLLLNKVDLLQQIISRGYVNGVDGTSVSELALAMLKPISTKIERACSDNDIANFSTGLVSAKTGLNVKETFGPLLEEHSRLFGERG